VTGDRSRTVILGFVNALAILIFLAQVPLTLLAHSQRLVGAHHSGTSRIRDLPPR